MSAYFLIGTDGRHHGPLSQDDVRAWLVDGRANRYSRARRESEEQWAALREMPEFEEATRHPYVGSGVPEAPSTTEGTGTKHQLQRDATTDRRPRLDPVSCFRRAWWLVARDFATLGGWTLIVAMTIVTTSVVPTVGWVIGLLLNNLLTAGVYRLFLLRMRGVATTFNGVVATIRNSAGRLILAGMVQALITAPIVFASTTTSEQVRTGLLILSVPCLYLLVAYVFILPLIVDRDLPFWAAMETSRRTVHRQWFQTFGLLFAAGLLLIIPARWFVFGLVLTLPISTAALMFAYEDLFGDS
jgi:hypothetical protein